jgi:putative hemolysin
MLEQARRKPASPIRFAPIVAGPLEVRLATSAAELEAAQRLRYEVFMEEWGACADDQARRLRLDADAFDAGMEHLVVLDRRRPPGAPQVVGNYRLLRLDPDDGGAYYSSGEFDLGPLLVSGRRLLELGRSCVMADYRGGAVLQLLWRAIAAYVAQRDIGLLFGCASLRGTDPSAVAEPLAFLHRCHLAPPDLRPRARGPTRIDADPDPSLAVDVAHALRQLEPIVRGYLRAGAWVGEGAYVDHAFQSIDVCIVLPTERMAARHRQNFERKLARPMLATVEAQLEPGLPALGASG